WVIRCSEEYLLPIYERIHPPVILTFALLCLAVLVFSEFTGYRYVSDWFVTHRGPLDSVRTYLTMFTYVLGHASIEHFAGNMMLLLLVGPVVEEKYGSKNTLIIILVTAFLTAAANMAVTANGLIGCSGVVFAFIILCSMTSFKRGEIPVTMILVVVLYLGQEILAGVLTADNVSQMAHILGGIAGAAFGFFLEGGRRR
uniref:rhomboid family intramembrane serine protease n=1 Tax=uncultured Faecalibaculum sp. TaxID=1729681 RepID=UPI00272C035E